MNFAKFLRTPFLTEHIRWLLLEIARFQKLRLIKRPENPKATVHCFSLRSFDSNGETTNGDRDGFSTKETKNTSETKTISF